MGLGFGERAKRLLFPPWPLLPLNLLPALSDAGGCIPRFPIDLGHSLQCMLAALMVLTSPPVSTSRSSCLDFLRSNDEQLALLDNQLSRK